MARNGDAGTTRLGQNGGMSGGEWEAAVCASGPKFGRVRTCAVGAMFYEIKNIYVISAMD